MEGLRNRLLLSPGVTLASNGECKIYSPDHIVRRKDGYTQLAFRNPATGKRQTVTPGRAVMMLIWGPQIPSCMSASHLCHNKNCVTIEHVCLEPQSVNHTRRRCVTAGYCLGHGSYLPCRLDLKLGCKEQQNPVPGVPVKVEVLHFDIITLSP